MAAESCVGELSESDTARCLVKTIKFDDEPAVWRLQQQVEYCTEHIEDMIALARPMRSELLLELPVRLGQHIRFAQSGDTERDTETESYREHWGAIGGGPGAVPLSDSLSEEWEEPSKLIGGEQSGEGWRLLPPEHSPIPALRMGPPEHTAAANIDMMVTSASEMMSSPGPPGMYSSSPLGCSAGASSRSSQLPWITADGTL